MVLGIDNAHVCSCHASPCIPVMHFHITFLVISMWQVLWSRCPCDCPTSWPVRRCHPEKSQLQSDPGVWFHFNKASLAHKSRLLHAESMESSCSLCNLTSETLCNEAMTMNDHGVDDWNDFWKIEKVCPSKCLVLVRCWSAAAWDNSPDVNRVQKNNLLSYAMPQASDA